MSREIKFRAWDKKNGYYADYEDIEEEITTQAITGWSSENGGVSFTLNYGIKDSEIEQYTGLKDKNGREIYEGDIVKVGILSSIFRVTYNAPCAMFWKENKTGLVEEFGDWDVETGIEVIGNIHENEELGDE